MASKRKRNCRKTCRAARLEHAIKLAQNELEKIAVRICKVNSIHPNLRLSEEWQDLCQVIDDLESDVQDSRKVHDSPTTLQEIWNDIDHDEKTKTTEHLDDRPPRRRAA